MCYTWVTSRTSCPVKSSYSHSHSTRALNVSQTDVLAHFHYLHAHPPRRHSQFPAPPSSRPLSSQLSAPIGTASCTALASASFPPALRFYSLFECTKRHRRGPRSHRRRCRWWKKTSIVCFLFYIMKASCAALSRALRQAR